MGTNVTQAGGARLQFIGTYAWANRPSASTNTGKTFFCTDIGGGVLMVSDGTVWRGPSGSDIGFLNSGITMMLLPSGSVADNGALTLGKALPITYDMGLYGYFKAGALYAGSAAGLYWVVMSSTTVGAVYADTYTSGKPVAPTSPTPIVATGPGAYTQTTGSDIVLLDVTVPGGFLGKQGIIDIWAEGPATNNANSKSAKAKIGASTLNAVSPASNTGWSYSYRFMNSNLETKNGYVALPTGSGNAITRTTIDTTANFSVQILAQMATATDFVGLEHLELKVKPG